MDFRYSITADEREKIYNEVWTDPVTSVAARYDLSDNGLRKYCRRYGIPLPPLGYWARVRAGQKVQKSSLPKVTGDLKKYIRNYIIKYRTDIDQLPDDVLRKNEDLSLLQEETKAFIRETCSHIQVKGQLRNPNKLITEHKEEIIYRKKRDKALKQANFSSSYYASVKSKYRDNKPILPINVSELNINRAYRIVDAMISTLDEMEAYTSVSHQSDGKDRGSFRIMHAYFRFEIKERARKKKNKDNKEEPPCLIMSLFPASWLYNSNYTEMIYQDQSAEPLELQVGKIIYEMFVVANKLQVMDELKNRQEKRQEEEEQRQRRLEKMRAGELEEIKLLEQVSSDWERAQRIRQFTDCMGNKVQQLEDEQKKKILLNWLQWARDKADWLDPLTDFEDEILGKSQHIFDVILDSKSDSNRKKHNGELWNVTVNR